MVACTQRKAPVMTKSRMDKGQETAGFLYPGQDFYERFGPEPGSFVLKVSSLSLFFDEMWVIAQGRPKITLKCQAQVEPSFPLKGENCQISRIFFGPRQVDQGKIIRRKWESLLCLTFISFVEHRLTISRTDMNIDIAFDGLRHKKQLVSRSTEIKPIPFSSLSFWKS